MSDYTHDDAMRDLRVLDGYTLGVKGSEDSNEHVRLAAYIKRIEAECDTLRDAMSWYCGRCNTMYPYESVKDASGVLPKCPKCGDYATTETARRNAYTAALERDYGKVVAERDEWKRVAEWLAGHIIYARKHQLTINSQDCPKKTACDWVDCYSESCPTMVLNAAIEAVRKEATDE